MESICQVCQQKLKDTQGRPEGLHVDFFSCPQCGDYFVSKSVLSVLPGKLESEKDAGAKISHMLRQAYEYGEIPTLYTNTIVEILKRKLPNPREQADLFIRWLGKTIDGPGETIDVNSVTHKSILGAKSDAGFALIVKHLVDSGPLNGTTFDTMGASFGANVTLSFEGWDYYEDLNRGSSNYRKAFIAMKFGDQILDHIVDSVFKPFVKQAGFDLFKLDDEPKAGLIDDRLRVEIQSSQFLIADLSHDNPGAYWEAGYAEGLGKPVIYTCEKSKFEKEKTHFDTNHHLTIIWNSSNSRSHALSLKTRCLEIYFS
jgi:hypothetical protein